ncbi:MAG: Tad domain-containing protein [Anaerolineales bacterium]
MINFKSQRGQAIILLAFAIVGLVGFGALAIDGGRVLSDRRHAQNAADTAALAAALKKIQGGNTSAVIAAAQNRALSNGYNDTTDLQDVIVNMPPVGGQFNGNSEYIQVIIKSRVNTAFARVIGRPQVENVVEAVARVQGATSNGSFLGNAGLIATQSGNVEQCLLANGGALIRMHNTGIFINCTSSRSIFVNGGATLDMDSNGETPGCFYLNGQATVDPITCGAPAKTITAATFADVPTTQPPPTCSGNGSVTGSGVNSYGTPPQVNVNSGTATFNPGNYSSISINSSSVFNPGVYCISGSFNVNGQATISGPSGRVQFVMGNTSLNLDKTPNNFNDLEMYTTNGNLSVKGDLTANRFRFFSTGNGTMDVQNGTFTSNNAYIYLASGDIKWNAQAMINLHAPPQGDPFGGLLFHKPWTNTTDTILNGGSNVHLTGTFMVPHSNVTFNGGNGFELHGQVVGFTFKLNGGSVQDIYYVPGENYNPPSSPTIEIAK